MAAEREELLEKINKLIAAADCYCVTYPVPNEHVDYVYTQLISAGYVVSSWAKGAVSTPMVISFEHVYQIPGQAARP